MPKLSSEKILIELKKIGRGIKKLRFFKFTHLPRTLRILSRTEKIVLTSLLLILLGDIFFSTNRFYINKTRSVPAYGGSYSEGLLGKPRFINPALAQTQTDKDLTRLVYSGLLKYDNQGNIIPDLLESDLQISADEKQYTAKLKSNLKWHDGQSLDADDIIFTLQLLKNPDYKSPYRKLWQNIAIEKIDNLTIRFTNPDVSSPFITNLTTGILPEHIWSKVSPENFYFAKANLEPIGSGPYYLKEINKSVNGEVRSIGMESYSNYYFNKPFIDQVTIKFYPNYEQLLTGLQTKEVDSVGFIPFDKKILADVNKSKFIITKTPLFQYQALFFNTTRSSKVLAEKGVRQALAISVDRENFISEVYSGLAIPAYVPILPGQIGYDPANESLNKFDLNNAESILEKNGWLKTSADGIRAKNGQLFKFSITTNDFVLNVKSAENLQKQWQRIGAEVSVNIVPTAEFEKNNLRPRNFEALLFSESTGHDPDPFVFWHSSQALNPGFNLAQFNNTQADRLITDARSTFDKNARAAKYASFENIFSAELPTLILNQSIFVYEMRQKVQGINFQHLANPEDRFYGIDNWYVQTKRVLR